LLFTSFFICAGVCVNSIKILFVKQNFSLENVFLSELLDKSLFYKYFCFLVFFCLTLFSELAIMYTSNGQTNKRNLKMSVKMLDRETNFEFMDRCVDHLGETTVLEALIKALPADQVNDVFEYICTCYEIPYKDIISDDNSDKDDEY
jgi:hypothetical protein